MSLVLLLGPQLRAFAEAGFEVHTASAAGPYVARLEAWGIPHHPLRHATRSVAPGRDVAAAVELEGLFRRIRPDIVHTHNPKPGLYGRLGARAARVPVVVNTVHGLYATPDDPLVRRGVVYALERLAATCSDAELVQNEEDLRLLSRLGVPRDRLHLLGNGVDLERFRPGRLDAGRRAALRQGFGAGPDDVVVGAVGRLVAEKGYPELFAAAAELARVTPRIRLVVVGPDDPDKADALDPGTVSAAREAGVRFLGNRDDVEDLYGAFDCYVLASHREGFPRSAMEAAASGLPVVATDIRGCRQVVSYGETGLLVPVGDGRALAGALAALAGDPARRAAMGTAGRAKAEREFDQRQVIAKTLAVYDELLGRHSARLRTTAPPRQRRRGGDRHGGSADRLTVRPGRPHPQGGVGPPRPGDEGELGSPASAALRPACSADVEAIARLHRSALPDAFLSSLGEDFLALLYRRMLEDERCFVFVAEATGPEGAVGAPGGGTGEATGSATGRPEVGLAGFVAGTVDTRQLYRDFLLRDGPRALWTAGPALAKHSPRVLESLRYGLLGGGADPAPGAGDPGPGDPGSGRPVQGYPGPGRAGQEGPAEGRPAHGGAGQAGPGGDDPERGARAPGRPARVPGNARGTSGLPRAELLALAVAPRARRQGVGRDLVAAFQSEVAARRLGTGRTTGASERVPNLATPLARVVVAEANEAARALYARAGFRIWDVTELHRGRRSAILVWP